jgi:hypothetical protein
MVMPEYEYLEKITNLVYSVRRLLLSYPGSFITRTFFSGDEVRARDQPSIVSVDGELNTCANPRIRTVFRIWFLATPGAPPAPLREKSGTAVAPATQVTSG